MIKNKIDYKIINCALIMVIIFLLYKMGGLWIGIVKKIWDILLPFIIAFAIAYALEPLVKYLTEHKVPKALAFLIIILLFVSVVGIFGVIVFPLLFNQLGSLFSGIMKFLNEISFDLDLDIGNTKNEEKYRPHDGSAHCRSVFCSKSQDSQELAQRDGNSRQRHLCH